MLKIKIPEELLATGCDPKNFFDLNGDEYVVVEDQSPADILCVMSWPSVDLSVELKKKYPHKISVEVDIWHGFENYIEFLQQHCKNSGLPYADNHYLITHIAQGPLDYGPNIIYTDHCYNKAKGAYTNFPYSPDGIPTNVSTFGAFVMPKLKNRSHNKIFLAPNRVDTARQDHLVRSRFAIHQLVQSGYNNLGYTSDGTSYLHSHADYPYIHDMESLLMAPAPAILNFGGVHNLYYIDTFISIYGETLEFGNSCTITEKTYDPLAKGHFILPFSTYKFLDMVVARGFKLPDFIDYSYDSIEDFDQRLASYIKEAERLLQIPLEQWHKLYQENLNLLRHNQLVFHRRDYQTVNLAEILSRHT